MRRATYLTTLALLAGLLAACQEAPPALSFAGVSTVEGEDRDLTLTVRRYGARLTGEYRVDAVRGAFAGTLDGDVVEAELKPSDTCTYGFSGVLTDAGLTGSFEPTGCPGGKPGTWDLARL